jgi:predicted ATP-grasp superfamily ATP-dependent carboligase
MSARVLIAGVSARAVAESAARAGFDVVALDAFGDLDQHPSVRALSLPRDFDTTFTASAAARVSRDIACDAVVYASTFENHPRAVRTLAAGRALWGNAPDVLEAVRDPIRLAHAFRHNGVPAPSVRTVAPARGAWLVKPVASGGGRGIRRWRAGAPLPRRCYLQEFIDGTPGSVVFVAAGGRAVPLGISRQLAGDAAFGASGCAYCGNILVPAASRDAERLASVAAAEFNLVGVNSVDFVTRAGVAYPIEVNPRWSGSMELVERAYGVSVFAAHSGACSRGVLPDFILATARRGTHAAGKAIVFARRDVPVGETSAWIDAGIRDVPHRGERIPAGKPVCTVLAGGRDAAACYGDLVRRANAVYSDLEAWERRVA